MNEKLNENNAECTSASDYYVYEHRNSKYIEDLELNPVEVGFVCPRCNIVGPCMNHGQFRECHVCGLEMQTFGNALYFRGKDKREGKMLSPKKAPLLQRMCIGWLYFKKINPVMFWMFHLVAIGCAAITILQYSHDKILGIVFVMTIFLSTCAGGYYKRYQKSRRRVKNA